MSWTIAEWLKARKNKPARQTVSVADLHEGLLHQLRGYLTERCKIRLADRAFATVTEDKALGFVRASATFWTPEINDCDDQAVLAKAEAIRWQFKAGAPAAFGIVWTDSHAFNWHLDEQLRVRFLDQPGQYVRPGAHGPINLILA